MASKVETRDGYGDDVLSERARVEVGREKDKVGREWGKVLKRAKWRDWRRLG